MNTRIAPKKNPPRALTGAAEESFESRFDRRPHGFLRALIWGYLILIILEGPLRKWILPGLANHLLLVRDPVLVLIYLTAFSTGVFPGNWMTSVLAVVGAVTTALAVVVGHGHIGVALYGLDANFLHLPLIFVIGSVMDKRDVLKVGRWILILAIPMAILMAIQFRSHPNAFVNFGPGASPGSQMQSVLGKIRPPGLFTFVTGAAMFITLATAFVIFGFLQRKVYHRVLLYLSTLALIISAAVSSSRLVLGGISVVFLMIGVIGLYNRAVVPGALGMLVPIGIVFMIATTLDVFHEGTHVFEARLQNTGDAQASITQTASSWSERILGGFMAGFQAAEHAPVLGRGIGYGTNIGARLLTGQVQFTADEREWGRVVYEMGLLGIPYLITRIGIFARLFMESVKSARVGNFLPMLLLGSCGLGVLNGQFGVASTLAFTVFQAGLCLAAAHVDTERGDDAPEKLAPSARIKVRRGRAPYAATLHAEGDQRPAGV